MKKSKKLLTFAASLFALTVAVSCGGGGTSSGTPTSTDTPVSEPAVSEPVSEPEVSAPEVSEPEPEVSEPEVDTGLADAVAMLNEVMKDKNTVTTSSFDVPAIVDTVDYTYQVEWSLDVKADGVEGAVALGEKTNAKQTIAIKYEENFNTVDTYYDLKAVVSGEKLSENLTFEGFKVPQFKYSTIAEWIQNKDTETPTSIQGVVTAVNKTDAASAFTITDETGTAFSYDAPSAQLNVGDEVVISSVYSDYNGFPQLKAPQVVKTIATDQLAKVASYMETVDINTISENLANYVSDPTSISTKYLKITGGYVVLNANGYPTLSVAADNPSYCVNLYYHSSELKSKVGAQVDVVCAVRGVGSSYIIVQVQSHEIIKEAEVTETYEEPAYLEKTVAEVAALASDEIAMKQVYKVTGTWTNVNKGATIAPEENTYGNGTITDAEGNSLTIYGFASTKDAATWNEVAGAYSFKNPKDFATELAYADGTEVTVGLIYSGTNFDNYYAFNLGTPTGGETPDVPEVPETSSKIELTVDSLGLASQSYSSSKATVSGVEFEWVQLGNYGDGIQVRDKNGNTSTFWNTVAFASGIEKIEMQYSSTQEVKYANPDAEIFYFGNDATVSSYSTKLSTTAGEKTYTITPDVNTYTFLKFEHDLGYTMYWDSITIYLAEDAGGETPEVPETPKSVAYIFNNGTVDGVDTSYVYDQKIEGSSVEWNGLTIDATSGKLAVRDTDTQMNQGTVISFDVEAGATVVVTSYPGYHNYTVNDVAVDADAYTVTFTEASTVTIVATGSAYLYSIVVTY